MRRRQRAAPIHRELPDEEEEQAPVQPAAPVAEIDAEHAARSARPPALPLAQSELLGLQRSAGNQAACRAIDALIVGEEEPDPEDPLHIDQADGGAAAPAAAPAGPAAPAAPAAVPTNLKQIVTNWTPGPTKYGFQLKFRCSSSSGDVHDLQAQAPNLTWREEVTYSRNDFAHRISPSNPTILPPGGVSFASSRTTVISQNELEFDNVTDTHWMPASAVRQEDFLPPATRPMPAVMESVQKYQFSTDGTNWTDFAGPFTLKREFVREIGPPVAGQQMYCSFTTNKVGIHSVTEPFKP